jgi:basic amino acid/polyamine antiporter, APA family
VSSQAEVTRSAGGAPISESGLVRALGVWGLAAGIFNITVGGGIFALPANPDIAGRLGSAAPLAYLVVVVAFGLIVLTFAEVGSRVSLTGGPYAYAEVALGPFVAFLTGVMLWLLGFFATAAVSTVFAASAGRLIPVFDTPAGRTILLIAAYATVTVINILGVKQGTRLIAVVSVLKLAPLLLLATVGFFAVNPDNLVIESTPASADLMRASIVLVFAFSGLESALVPSGEVRDPARTVPRGIFLAMGGITILYIAIQLVAQGILGDSLSGRATPLADAAEIALGPWGRTLLLVGVMVSTFGHLSGMTLAIPRATFAFARDGFLPDALARVHPRFHTPYIAIAAQSIITCALAIWASFGFLAVVANVAALLVYLMCAVAAIILRRRGVQAGGMPFKVPGGPVVPVLAIVVIVGLLTSIRLNEWAVTLGVLAAAALVFFATAGRRAARVTTA